MSTRADHILNHAESAIVEDASMAAARERAADLGIDSVSASVGAALTVLARIGDAKTIVEVGTGAGISGLWLLTGMRSDGVLTSIDSENAHHQAARESFTESGIDPKRYRLINGHASDVLTRLADSSYDIVFIDGPLGYLPDFVSEGIRLLRPHGALIVHSALVGADIQDEDGYGPDVEEVSSVREAERIIAEHDSLFPVILPLGEGLLVAAKGPAPEEEE